MASAAVIQARGRLAIVAGLLISLLVALHLMSSAVQNSAALARVFVPLLLCSMAGLAGLLVLIGLNLVRLVQAYRRDDCPNDNLLVHLRGLKPEGGYEVTDWDVNQPDVVSGRSLMETGLTVSAAAKPAAVVVTYRRVD